MTEPLDTLELSHGAQLSIVEAAEGLSAVPMVRTADGWRRARPGDGAAEALTALLAASPDPTTRGHFTIHGWTSAPAAGERPMGVDQTNESVIVGDAAVVKWATHLQQGPHPAPPRIAVLRDAGFTAMPAPWGLVTWRLPDGTETLVASVDGYLPGAVDGWTWAVGDVTEAALEQGPERVSAPAGAVGDIVADMHAALAGTAGVASAGDAERWLDAALQTLETACALSEINADRRCRIESELQTLGSLAGTPVIDGHGDLHVGQVLRSGDRYVVTDFDGNPVLPAAQRALPIPAAVDVAGMTQSLAHAAIVARKYTALDSDRSSAVDTAFRSAFLDAYRGRLTALGHADLYDPKPLRAFRIQQVLREIIYAARHLPRWMYVPDAALPALLDETEAP